MNRIFSTLWPLMLVGCGIIAISWVKESKKENNDEALKLIQKQPDNSKMMQVYDVLYVDKKISDEELDFLKKEALSFIKNK